MGQIVRARIRGVVEAANGPKEMVEDLYQVEVVLGTLVTVWQVAKVLLMKAGMKTRLLSKEEIEEKVAKGAEFISK